MCVRFSHQQTVEKDVDKHPQRADGEVKEMVEELNVKHHGSVTPREGSFVPHETHQEDYFIAHLEDEVNVSSVTIQQMDNQPIIIKIWESPGLG